MYPLRVRFPPRFFHASVPPILWSVPGRSRTLPLPVYRNQKPGKNDRKSGQAVLFSIPLPVSSTDRIARARFSPSSDVLYSRPRETVPPAPQNLNALDSKLTMIFSILSASKKDDSAFRSIFTENRMPLDSARERNELATVLVRSDRFALVSCSSIFPDSNLEMSSNWLIRR